MDLDQDQGIAASTNRDEVEYVITEFGIADLRGKSIRERTLALIHIAHPKFRAELMKVAKERRYVYADQILPEHAIYPDQFESSITLMDGSRILIRPARPTDERVVQSFLYGMDEASIRYRFHGKLEAMHHSRVQEFVNLDYDGTFTLLGLRLGEAGEEGVVGIGQYLFYAKGNLAEVAFTTAREYRNLGVATYLLRELMRLSRAKGIKTMFAEVIRENLPMLRVFRKSGVPMETHFEDGHHHVRLDLEAAEKPANDTPASSSR
jgi:GNAT superfamily N-acetyltransferase